MWMNWILQLNLLTSVVLILSRLFHTYLYETDEPFVVVAQCSVECGTGTTTRMVTCRADGRRVSDDLCNVQEKPPKQQLCHAHSCAHHTWFYTDWSEVSHNSVDHFHCLNLTAKKKKKILSCRFY